MAREHGFAFAPERLRVAVNDALVGWDHALTDGDEVVFLPPVSGG
ncbi:MAG TPA: MoaD/ThiS family protein [Rhodanobacteraceae bacterium]|nr:MoaD/ThiS family protein [Rhodanobacteraceae bacterium]